MTARGQAAPRTHDLEPLYAAVAATLGQRLPPLHEVVGLNPYGVQVRYLDEWLAPSETHALSALATAEEIHKAIRGAIEQTS